MANSIVGTWVINETLQSFTSVSNSSTTSFSVTGVYNSLNGDGSLVELPFNTVALYRYNTTTTFKIYCDESVSDYTFNSYYSQNNKVSLTGDIRVSYTSEYSLRYFGSSNENFGLLRTFTITGGDDVTNEKLIAWLEANATQVVETSPTEITYNGATTSIEAGQTATLACNGKKAVSDIVIAFGAAGTIAYNGTGTAVEAGKTATLACSGKKMVSDVVVALSADGGASLPETGVNAATGEITDTWEQIQEAISTGVYSTRYSVGNYKTVSTDAYGDIKMEIVAFDADTKADGSGTAAISWLSRDLIAKHVMNTEATNADGWAASEMRTWLQSEVLAALPADVQDAIVSVNKTYYDYTTQSTLEIEDNVWIPSMGEMFGNGYDTYGCEDSGAEYTSYFTDSASRVKNYSGSAAVWWLRSAYSGNYYAFRRVSSDGSSNDYRARASYGVALGFCT